MDSILNNSRPTISHVNAIDYYEERRYSIDNSANNYYQDTFHYTENVILFTIICAVYCGKNNIKPAEKIDEKPEKKKKG